MIVFKQRQRPNLRQF